MDGLELGLGGGAADAIDRQMIVTLKFFDGGLEVGDLVVGIEVQVVTQVGEAAELARGGVNGIEIADLRIKLDVDGDGILSESHGGVRHNTGGFDGWRAGAGKLGGGVGVERAGGGTDGELAGSFS